MYRTYRTFSFETRRLIPIIEFPAMVRFAYPPITLKALLILLALAGASCSYDHGVRKRYTERIEEHVWKTSALQSVLSKEQNGEARYSFWFVAGAAPSSTFRWANSYEQEDLVLDELRSLPFHEIFSLETGKRYTVSVWLIARGGRARVVSTLPSPVGE